LDKRRVNTTISTKHWEILKKQAEKYESQQKVLEAALESFENYSKKSPALSPEEQHWIRIGREIMAPAVGIIIHKELFKALIETADFELIAEVITNQKLAEHMGFWYFQRPFNKLSLKEVIDGLILYFKMGFLLDAISYTDEGNCYMLKITHSININYSKLLKMCIEDVLNVCVAKNESEIYEKNLFIKIYKNIPNCSVH